MKVFLLVKVFQKKNKMTWYWKILPSGYFFQWYILHVTGNTIVNMQDNESSMATVLVKLWRDNFDELEFWLKKNVCFAIAC